MLSNALKILKGQINKEMTRKDTQQFLARITLVKAKITELSKTLCKESKIICMQKSAMFPVQQGDKKTVIKFLNSDRLFKLVEQNLAKDIMDGNEHLLVKRYLMCNMMYRNAQQQGPVVGLKLSEFTQAKECKTPTEHVIIYKVREHKTNGLANLVMQVALKKVHPAASLSACGRV